MNNISTLEILIPTYNRSESAIKAITSCLNVKDQRLTVRCNSNGFDPELEKFRNLSEKLIYDCFDKNRGILANVLFLLSQTNARYAMLLSDEDEINDDGAKNILDFLDDLPSEISAVSCSIFDNEKKEFYSITLTPDSYSFNLNDFLLYGQPVPSYMSGLIFSVEALKKINLECLYRYSVGNAYPHLDVVLCLLETGSLRFYNSNFVNKGAEINFGGEGFEHRQRDDPTTINNLDLNPLVYGPRARARQYFYQEKKFFKLQTAGKYAKIIARLYIFIGFYRTIKISDKVTIIKDGCSIREEVRLAKYESIQNGEWSGSLLSRLFTLYIRLPWSVGEMLFIFLRLFLRFHKKYICKYPMANNKFSGNN